MKPYQRQFIEFALSKQVLKFGEFTLKSGRKSPYFFNAGLFNTGRDLALLGRFYAEALVDSGIEFDLLFGPAYKGIPIATTTAVAMAEHHDLAFCEGMLSRFVRSEFKYRPTDDFDARWPLIAAQLQ